MDNPTVIFKNKSGPYDVFIGIPKKITTFTLRVTEQMPKQTMEIV
jgi:hypothetical protein